MRTWMRGSLAASTLALLSACGGAPKPDAQAGPSGGGGTASTGGETGAPAPTDKAGIKFVSLSEQIEKLGEGKPVDIAWLEQQLREVIALNAGHQAARFNLAVIQEKRGDVAGARAAYQQIHKEAPDFAPAAENVAAQLVEEGRVSDAAAIYRGLVEKDPKNTTSRLALARIALTEKNYEEAEKLCREVLQRQADAVEAFRVLGASHRANGNLPMAELIIARGLKVEKDDVQLHYLLSQILLDRGDLAGAVNKLKYIITQRPSWLKVRAQLADIALQYRDFGNASQHFEAILKEQPDSRPAKIGLAVSFKGLGRYDQAEKLYQEVLKANGEDVDVLWNLAVLYHRHLNKYDDAIAMYQRAQKAGGPGDQQLAEVENLVKEIQKTKSDQAAMAAREEAERKKREAVEAACQAIAAKQKPNAEAIGNDEERAGVAWQLLVNAQAIAQEAAQGGDASKVAEADAIVACAYGIIPDNPQAATQVCAPMKVEWTQVLYQLGRLDDALATIKEALKCDAENPNAKLIEQQLMEIIQQQKGGESAPSAEAPK